MKQLKADQPKELIKELSKLPDKKLFNSLAPSVKEKRKVRMVSSKSGKERARKRVLSKRDVADPFLHFFFFFIISFVSLFYPIHSQLALETWMQNVVRYIPYWKELATFFNSNIVSVDEVGPLFPVCDSTVVFMVSRFLSDSLLLFYFFLMGYVSSGQLLDSVKLEGFLVKKGKNLGGWLSRYFVVKDDVIEYYDTVSAGPYN
jgi:hypothetical protein